MLKHWSSKDFERINQICRMLLHLNSEGISVPVPLTTVENEFVFEFKKGNRLKGCARDVPAIAVRRQPDDGRPGGGVPMWQT